MAQWSNSRKTFSQGNNQNFLDLDIGILVVYKPEFDAKRRGRTKN